MFPISEVVYLRKCILYQRPSGTKLQWTSSDTVPHVDVHMTVKQVKCFKRKSLATIYGNGGIPLGSKRPPD